MENNRYTDPQNPDSAVELPYLFQYVASNSVSGFDTTVESSGAPNSLNDQAGYTLPAPNLTKAKDSNPEPASSTTSEPKSPVQPFDSPQSQCTSTNMHPSSPAIYSEQTKKILFKDEVHGDPGRNFEALQPSYTPLGIERPGQAKFYSQPMPFGHAHRKAETKGSAPHWSQEQTRNINSHRRDVLRYESFKTWSGKLERQISQLVGRPRTPKSQANISEAAEIQPVPVDRYFAALEGPELETLRPSEELVLPNDKPWPFLMRFPISAFGICLGIGSQANLWKLLSTCQCTEFLHVSPEVNLVLWCITLALSVIISIVYTLKVIFFFEAVRREYYHPIRVNFFFAPWVACLFLAMGLPPQLSRAVPHFLWYVLMTPILCLELKIYGQWMSGGQRRLSKVANPSNHLSVIGNFVGALLGASMGLKEGPIFFFSVGVAHYIVLFVTLYQRLPTNETLPKELHPVFFLFVAAPSVASIAWATLQGHFDYGARIAYFISLFLYFSLAVRINFFRGFRFSLAWWAYTFPMTGASIATIRYAMEVETIVARALAILLSAISTITASALLVSTMIHAFVLRDLFPNDIAIAISQIRAKAKKGSRV